VSIRLMSKVFDSELPSTEKFVLLAMADYASDSGESIFPSVETLSRKTSLSERAVQKSIKSLLLKGFLVLVEEGGGRSHTNLYRIEIGKFEEFKRVNEVQGVNVVRLKGERGSLKGERGAPESLVNHQLTINGLPKSNRYKMMVQHFPTDTWEVLSKVCELWKLTPPEKGKNRYTQWIKAGRELEEACGEFGVSLLEEVYDNWNEHRYMVSSPGSLVASAIGIAGRKRMGVVVAPSVSADLSYRWNSDLSEEENRKLMQETIRKVQKAKGDQNEE